MISQSAQKAYDVAVVGAGAAGQMSAIAAAEEGRNVVLLEQMDRPGLKVLASGGGRCNLTSMVSPAAFRAAFGRQGRFTDPAMKVMGPAALRELMARLGVPTIVEDGVNVYPASLRAADVQDAMRRRCEKLGVELRPARSVSSLWIEAGRLMGVETSRGERLSCGRVVLACGGKTWAKLGGTGGGYALAEQAGHEIVEPLAALVPLVTRERWPERLAGVAVPNARVRIDLPGQSQTPAGSKAGLTGDILLTHRGISGPVVLDISGTVSQLLRQGPVPLRIELVAGDDAGRWVRRLEDWRMSEGSRTLVNLLRQYLPQSLCAVLCELAGVDGQTQAAHLPAGKRDAIARVLGGLELNVTDTEGFDAGFVTRGGVKLAGVDPQTLASRLLAGLYLAGEMLDLDGPCGGFNLQWAFAGGWLAGKSAARR